MLQKFWVKYIKIQKQFQLRTALLSNILRRSTNAAYHNTCRKKRECSTVEVNRLLHALPYIASKRSNYILCGGFLMSIFLIRLPTFVISRSDYYKRAYYVANSWSKFSNNRILKYKCIVKATINAKKS